MVTLERALLHENKGASLLDNIKSNQSPKLTPARKSPVGLRVLWSRKLEQPQTSVLYGIAKFWLLISSLEQCNAFFIVIFWD